MGSWLSRKKPAAAELESLSKAIHDAKEDIELTFESKRSVLTYASLMSFFLVSSASAYTWLHLKRNLAIFLCLSFVVLGFLLLLVMRKAIIRFYDWRLERKKFYLEDALKKKHTLLESVKETEKYKVVQELIEKYGDAADLQSEIELVTPPARRHSITAAASGKTAEGKGGDMRSGLGQGKRLQPGVRPDTQRRTPSPTDMTPAHTPIPGKRAGPPVPSVTPSFARSATQMPPPGPKYQGRPPPFNLNSPHPVRPFQRPPEGAFEKLVDFFFGDGPGNRLALICSNCHFHNGMALQEEYDSLSYVCYNCGHYNESKIARPMPQSARRPMGPPSVINQNPNGVTKTPFIPRKPTLSNKTLSRGKESMKEETAETVMGKQSSEGEAETETQRETARDEEDSDKNTIESYDQLQELEDPELTAKSATASN